MGIIGGDTEGSISPWFVLNNNPLIPNSSSVSVISGAFWSDQSREIPL